MPLDSGQHEKLANAVRGQMKTGEGHQGGKGSHRTAGVGALLSSSPTGSSEQHHKRHKAQNGTSYTAMSIDGAGVSEYVVGDDPRS
jgi:hypothetical protein